MRQFQIDGGMMNLSKLGITPGPWKWDGNVWDYHDVEEAPWLITKEAPVITGQIECNYKNARLIATAPEMIMWIIGMVQSADNNDIVKAAKLLELGPEVIEKAIDKKWPKIKETLCDNSK